MDSLNFNSVETLPNLSARAAFQVNSSAVFKEDVDIVPVIIDDTLSYVPWGGDNNMPFDILKLIEDDETLSTCQMFNAEVCFGSGLRTTLVLLLPRRIPRRVYRQSAAGTCRCESVAHFLAGCVLRRNVVSRPRHHRPSERNWLEVGALSRTSPQDTRHRGIACRGIFLTRTDGAVEKRGAAEDAHGRPCPRHQRHPRASR